MKTSHLTKFSGALGVAGVRLPAEGPRGGTGPRTRQGSEHRGPPTREGDERPLGFAEDHPLLEDADYPREVDRRQVHHGLDVTGPGWGYAVDPRRANCDSGGVGTRLRSSPLAGEICQTDPPGDGS